MRKGNNDPTLEAKYYMASKYTEVSRVTVLPLQLCCKPEIKT